MAAVSGGHASAAAAAAPAAPAPVAAVPAPLPSGPIVVLMDWSRSMGTERLLSSLATTDWAAVAAAPLVSGLLAPWRVGIGLAEGPPCGATGPIDGAATAMGEALGETLQAAAAETGACTTVALQYCSKWLSRTWTAFGSSC